MEDILKYIKDGITISGSPEKGYRVFTIPTQNFNVSKLSELTADKFEEMIEEQKSLEDSLKLFDLDPELSKYLDELHQENIKSFPSKPRFGIKGDIVELDDSVVNAFHKLNKASDKTYTEEDLIAASKYGYEYRDTTSFPDKSFEDNCLNNTRQWISGVLDRDKGDV